MPLRCLIVDDNPSFREAMSALLKVQGIDVLGDAGSAAEAFEQIAKLRPDVVLIDIDLGAESGFALARGVPGRGGEAAAPKVILISTHDESEFADLIDASSAVGFLSKAELSAAAIHGTLAAAHELEEGSG